MTRVKARLSDNRKYAICGACARSLARRQIQTIGGRATADLQWDADWHVIRGSGDVPTHIARSATALDRLDRGNAPLRRGFEEGEQTPPGRGFPERHPALCPWGACGALNEISERRLQVRQSGPMRFGTLSPRS